MSNSSLVSYTKISPNKNSPRNHKIDTITIHCVVGQLTVEKIGAIFANSSTDASSNYGIGTDGKIGMYVEEKDRSWCSSNRENDHRAITIECASDMKAPYAINDKVYESLIELCVDICKRNDIPSLKWKADKSLIGQPDKQNMTVHRWFANKDCPGDYIYSRLGAIAEEVNKRLGYKPPAPKPSTNFSDLKAGTKLSLKGAALYVSSSAKARSATKTGTFYVWSNEVVNSRIRITNDKTNVGKDGQVTGWIAKSTAKNSIASSSSKPASSFKSYKVKVDTATLNIRKGPGTNYAKTGKFTGKGVFTIVDQSKGTGSKAGWGKLKSGMGWISLDYAKKI